MTVPALSINIAVGATGATPTPPATIWNNLLAYLQATVPGFTVLPGLLIEDILSTDVAAVVLCDQAAVEAINSLTPQTANVWLLYLLGQLYGVPEGQTVNTAVYVQFASPDIGFVINAGYLVGDGTYQYVVQEGGAIGSSETSQLLYVVATQPGTWAVPANSVIKILSSIPGGITLSVTNPNTGIPSAAPQTVAQYRAAVLAAGIASAQSMQSFLKVQLGLVPGVQTNLVSVVQINGGGWEVIVGGGDPYQVANAIRIGIGDISSLVGSTMSIIGITNATLGVVTTFLNHGLVTGQNNVYIADVVGMSGVNGGPYTVTVIDEKNFTFGVNTTSSGGYASGGVITPNNRNVVVNLIDYPDTYTIPFVVPPVQTVTVQVTWNTDAPNFVSPTAVAQLVAPAVALYINSLYVGRPINEFELNAVFQGAVAPILLPDYLSRIIWTISINGVSTPVQSGTGLVIGDPESSFSCVASSVLVNQG